MADYDYEGKNGTVKITKEGSVSIQDNETNTTYAIKNKKDGHYGINNFTFDAFSGTDVIKGYDGSDKLNFIGATDLKYYKKGSSNDLIVTKNSGRDKLTLKNFFGVDEDKRIQFNGQTVNNIVVTGSGKINGTNYNDEITGSKKSDKITTGNGDDEVYSGKGKDTITINGSGNKKLFFYDGDGNNTVVFDDKTAVVTFDLSEKEEYVDEYIKSGNDLFIKTFYENNKGKDVAETITAKNIFNEDKCDFSSVKINEYNTSTLDAALTTSGLTVKGIKNVFEGSKYNDEIVGTKKVDIITTGDGNDKIYAGKGNNIITINGGCTDTLDNNNNLIKGAKEIYINNGDGKDTINFDYEGASTANLIMNSTNIYMFEDTGDGIDIIRMYDSKGKIKQETTSVAKNDKLTVQINGVNISDMPQFEEGNIDKLSPNKKNDAMINAGKVIVIGGSKDDKISLSAVDSVVFAGKGNDEITVSERNGESNTSTVVGGKGNDIINFNMKGKATVSHVSGDGNDTIYLTDKPSDLTINVDYTIAGKNEYDFEARYMYYQSSGKNGFRKSGDDLIIMTPAGGKKSETITVKDYFAAVNNMPDGDVKINETVHSGIYSESGTVTVKDMMKDNGIWADGEYNGETGITTYNAYGSYNNFYSYSGSGKTIFNGGVKDDIYYTTLGKKSDLYIDTGVSDTTYGDTLVIDANHKKVRAFFNIDSYGDVVVTDDGISDNFMIFNKGSLTTANVKKMFDNDDSTNALGAISINKFFKKGGYDYGYIEEFTVSNNFLNNLYNMYKGGYKKIGDISTEYWLDEVKEKVANWLCSYMDGKYSEKTAFDVISEGTDKDITSLLNVYQSVSNGAVFEEYE